MNEDNWVWTDELVAEYGEYYRKKQGVDYSTWGKCILDAFKKSKESTIPDKDWEILYIKNTNTHNNIYWRSHYGDYWVNGLGERFEYDFSTGSIKKGCEIHSVRRKDGEVFTVDGKFLTDYSYELTVNNFQIVDNKILVWSKERGYWPLNSIKPLPKPKVPLFTIDGIGIFEGDTFWTVNKQGFTLLKWAAYRKYPNQWTYPELEYFSSEQKANEYILLNKPTSVIELYQHDVFERGVDTKKYCYVLTLSKPLEGSNTTLKSKIEEAINQK